MNLAPSTVQISIHEGGCAECPLNAEIAWEIEGASALSRIAKHAIQIRSCPLLNNVPIENIIAEYQSRFRA